MIKPLLKGRAGLAMHELQAHFPLLTPRPLQLASERTEELVRSGELEREAMTAKSGDSVSPTLS